MSEIPVIRLSRKPVRVSDGFVSRVLGLVGDYFAGEPVRFDGVRLDLDWCTPFQHALVDAARAVPRGETVTYGELAALAGRPNAARAAGTFCAQNRFGLVVPCHRVVAAAGLAHTGRSASTTSVGCSSSRARMPLSEDLRNELAAIAPRKDCDVLAELSGLRTPPAPSTCWAGGA